MIGLFLLVFYRYIKFKQRVLRPLVAPYPLCIVCIYLRETHILLQKVFVTNIH